jgi:1-phosphofructokinase family hexose kinase
MILILNLNMAIDKTMSIDKLELGKIYRIDNALTLPGGKGINVARVLKTLKSDFKIMGFIAGYNGQWIKSMLNRYKFPSELVSCDGESRICLSIVDGYGRSTDFNEEGASISLSSQNSFLNKFKNNIKKSELLIISGRTCKGIRKNFYSDIVSEAKKNGIPVLLDIVGKGFFEAVSQGADIIKINSFEFRDLFKTAASKKSIYEEYKKFKKRGLKGIIITDGDGPILSVYEGVFYKIIPAKLKRIKTPVGAGDSFMAALAWSILNKKDIEFSLKFASSAAASDCLTLGAGIINGKEIIKYMPKIKIMKESL